MSESEIIPNEGALVLPIFSHWFSCYNNLFQFTSKNPLTDLFDVGLKVGRLVEVVEGCGQPQGAQHQQEEEEGVLSPADWYIF